MVIQNHVCGHIFRFKAIVKPTIALLFSAGKARSNFRSEMRSQSMSPQPAIQSSTPHHGMRIFFASLKSFLMS